MAQYGKAEYWESRYSKDPDPFDWYQSYSSSPALRDIIRKSVYVFLLPASVGSPTPLLPPDPTRARRPPAATILIPGCGSSRMTEEMLADGFVNGIVSVDQSRAIIQALEDRAKGQPSLQCACAAAPGFRGRGGASARPIDLDPLAHTPAPTTSFLSTQSR